MCEIKIDFNTFPAQLFDNYLKFLVGKVWKLIPMKDYDDPNLYKYLESLLRELIGNYELMEQIKFDGNFQSLINKLMYLSINKDIDFNIFKKDVFDCIDLIKKIQEKIKNWKDYINSI